MDSSSTNSSECSANKRWRYDMLEAHAIATINDGAIGRSWLLHLLRIGVVACKVEKCHAASIGRKRKPATRINAQEDLHYS
eukprot:11310589-Ditylum_brightwellii.AAC.1